MARQTKHKRRELKDFGAFLRKAREGARLGQTDAAKVITDKIAKRATNLPGGSVSQSLIAQLESGTARNPDVAVLQAMADVYQIPYSTVIGELVKDKYDLEPVRADRLADDVRTVEELAQWEEEAKPNELWIVAPNFVDDSNAHIASTVLALLKGGTEITYFVNKVDAREGGRFAIFQSVMLEKFRTDTQGRADPKIECYPLEQEHVAWLATSFVIADPQQALVFASPEDGQASGFYVFPEESGKPSYGMAIKQNELRRLANNLVQVIHRTSEQEPIHSER